MEIQVSTNPEEVETQEAEDKIQEEEEEEVQLLLYIALFVINPAMQKKIVGSKANRDATNIVGLITSPKTVDHEMYNKQIRQMHVTMVKRHMEHSMHVTPP